MNSITDVWRKFSNKKYRAAFARAQFKRLVPLQIQTLRQQRGWSQEALAARAKLTQGVISRAEDQDYGNLTVNTILSIAEGLDVAFVGRFVRFGELDSWYVNLSRETMRVPSFDEENEAIIAAGDRANATAGARSVENKGGRLASVIGLAGARDAAQKEMAGKKQESSSSGLENMLRGVPQEGGSVHAAIGNIAR